MKRFVLLFNLLFLAICSEGQELYDSFLDEEKVWTMGYKVVNPNVDVTYFEEKCLKGDTIIEGICFKREWRRNWMSGDPKPTDWVPLNKFIGQDGRKVYKHAFSGSWSLTYLIMDFSLNSGDKFVEDYQGLALNYLVKDVSDTIISNATSESRRCIYVRCIERPSIEDTWIDGIGSLNYGIEGDLSLNGGSIPKLMEVRKNGTVIYSHDNSMSSIMQTKESMIQNIPTFFDLQGRRFTQQPQPGIYIRDGKKVVVKYNQ